MVNKRASSETIRDFIVNNVSKHPAGITRLAAIEFDISRQTANQHVQRLVQQGQLKASGNTKARRYELKSLVYFDDTIPVTPDLEEDVIWREAVEPYIGEVNDNVLDICQYGVTEMVNNVVSHSAGKNMRVVVERNPVLIKIVVCDDGVGIFRKIQQSFGYSDPRHALLELTKGKVTSDPDRHTGEGIFFASKMFDAFSLWSEELYYGRSQKSDDDWLIEVEDRNSYKGTAVAMEINPNSHRTIKAVFDLYASGENNDFSRTHVPIKLAKYEKEQLISRSQARRVLARFERFSEVILDFEGVDYIGQAFADEMFRVFRREHPAIELLVFSASARIQGMIRRVSGDNDELLGLS